MSGDPVQVYQNALAAFERGDWQRVLEFAGRILPVAPSHAGVNYLAGVAALQLHRVGLALGCLRTAAQSAPDRPDYLSQYARALAMANQAAAAMDVAGTAMAMPSIDATSLDTLGVVFSRGNDHARAAEAFRRAAEQAPGHAAYRFNYATSCMFFGWFDLAEREYEACLHADPTYWRAHLALAQLRAYPKRDNHEARLRDLIARHPHDAEAQLYLNLALAKELEDAGEDAAAMQHYIRGKAAYRPLLPYDPRRDRQLFETLERRFQEWPDARQGHGTSEPIFVVGMPRSGTTLVDRILSSHSAVCSAGELGNFGNLLQRVFASASDAKTTPGAAASATPSWAELGRAYIESTRPATGHSSRFVDKFPHNFLYAGFIARALPGAKIICVRRNPMDTCLSNFRQLFDVRNPMFWYSFDLLETGRYFLLFDQMMAFWNRVLPGRIFEVRYEDLVDAQENVTRTLLDACDLPWEDACLRFDTDGAAVASASAPQVRTQLNRSYVDRWKRHGGALGGLLRLLQEAGQDVG